MNYTRILEGVTILVLAGFVLFIGYSMWMTRENVANLFILKTQQDFVLTELSDQNKDISEIKDEVAEIKNDIADLKDVSKKLDEILNLFSDQEARLSDLEDDVAELKGESTQQ